MALSSSQSGESRFYPRESLNDLRSAVFWRDVVCETLATTVLITFLMLVVTGNNAHYVLTTTHIGFFAVIAVYLLLEGYGPFSSQMNPAVSLTLFLAGRISLARAVVNIIVQIVGTAAGSGLGYLMTAEGKRDTFPVFNPEANGLSAAQGMLIEGFFTFNLLFVALSCHDTVNRHPPAVMASLPIASCIAIGAICAGSHTGGLMNPLIAFGPALVTRDFTNQWLYWIGPLLGGPLAVPVYKLFIYIKLKYGPKPVVAAIVNSQPEESLALTPALQEDVIALLEKLKDSKCMSV